jgi:hypothetical protein
MPPLYQAIYDKILAALQELVQLSSPEHWDISTLKSATATIQQFFQTQILTLNLENLDPKVGHQVQSFNIEIDKQLKLLTVDTLFLQSAKHPETIAQRLKQIQNRLETLIRYCNALLELK